MRDTTLGIGALLALSGPAFVAGCGGPIANTPAAAASTIQKVTAVVALPPRLAFRNGGDQRRVARRTGDSLIEATGGHAILAEELASTEPGLIADGIRRLGEEPEQTLTFSVSASRSDRIEAAGVPVAGVHTRPTHHFADYAVRLEVRRADRGDILGAVEAFATCFSNAPEIDRQGRPQGVQRAIDDAIRQALRRFAPNLVPGAPFPTVVEVPPRNEVSLLGGVLAVVDKLAKLQVLYPEQPMGDLVALASSNAQFLVVRSGRLAALGLASGDLISGIGGRDLGSRGALARTLARGETPGLSIDRAGERFLIGHALAERQ